MTSVAVFGIGATGVVALQKATVAGNAYGGSLTTATQIAKSWVNALSMDSEQWGEQYVTPPPSTHWLNTAIQQNGQWHIPEHRATMDMGPAFDIFGQPVEPNDPATRFCTQIRTTWLCQPLSVTCGGAESAGNGLIRAEVQVFWPRRRPVGAIPTEFCESGVVPNTDDYHMVSLTSAIRQAAVR